ncbi:MAG: HEAT repeat domain-containing protein [bacterium]|nr:HEAT repeat domain-containing protein [bacterium]
MADEETSPAHEDSHEDTLQKITAEATVPVEEEDLPRSKLIQQFLIFPLAIVCVGLGIYFLLGLLTAEDQTASDYLTRVRVGGINSRWQAAYELSKVLGEEQQRGQLPRGFSAELIRVFEESRHDDVRVRRYLARAIGMVQAPEMVPVLIDALSDADDETRIYAMLSLGAQGDSRAVPRLTEMASNPDSGLRKAALYALAQINDPEVVPVLRAALGDRVPDVRWNAALQLSWAGDRSGLDVLQEMLNRAFLNSVEAMSDEQRRDVMIKAIRAMGHLDARKVKTLLETLRKDDPDLQVRQATIEVLTAWGEK